MGLRVTVARVRRAVKPNVACSLELECRRLHGQIVLKDKHLVKEDSGLRMRSFACPGSFQLAASVSRFQPLREVKGRYLPSGRPSLQENK